MITSRSIRKIQFILVGTFLLQLYACYRLFRAPYLSGLLWVSRRWLVIFGAAGLLAAGLIVLLLLTFTPARQKIFEVYRKFEHRLARLGKWNLLIFGAIFLLYAFLLLSPTGEYTNNQFVRYLLFWFGSLAGTILLKSAGWDTPWLTRLATAMISGAFIYRVAAYLPEITNYPLSLGWSEASRYYYASLYFAPQIYGKQVALTVLHPSRYLLQAIPFLIPDSPIWLHRLWQVFLWIAITLPTAWLVARRVTNPRSWLRIVLTAWSFLFLLIGPVYYHLSLIALVMVWGFDRRRFLRTTIIVLIASLWAGISRVNWFPMPAILAATLYLLEEPVGAKPIWKYISPIALWGLLGSLAAFGAQSAYALISGNPADQFASSFSSDLLWYRLLPNPTYPAGILISAAVVLLPLLAVICLQMKNTARKLHWLRWLTLAGMALVLFGGGLVVSVKIGGGSNLHNLDALMTMLLIVCLYFLVDRVAPEPFVEETIAERHPTKAKFSSVLGEAILGLNILIPIIAALGYGGPLAVLDEQTLNQSMERLQRFVNEVKNEPGEILFITERQLLTFKVIDGIELTPDYEKVFLMEMAMAGNPEYLEQFKTDLLNKRFSMIVTEPLFINYKGSASAFGEENDAWVKHVSEPVLCTYKAHKFLRDIRVQLLIPRETPGECP